MENNVENPFDENNTTEPQQEQSLVEAISEIEKRDTNFIFLFGRHSTGKSYITASLIYYMKVCDLGDLHVSASNSPESELLVEHMYDHFHTGRLIDRTQTIGKDFYEIDLIFTPKDKRLPKMKITFLEIAGEKLEKVQIKKGDANSGKLSKDLELFFMCNNIKLIFFLVADHATASTDSITINKFLDYILNKDENLGNTNYLLAITKWDTYQGKHKQNVEKFTAEAMPNIHNRLKNERVGNAITDYSIGRIIHKEENGKIKDEIKEIDIKRAEAVTKWLYKTITKKSIVPEPTLWDKIKIFFGI